MINHFFKFTFLIILIVLSHNFVDDPPQQTEEVPRVPVIDDEWWRISEAPDLDSLHGPDPNRQDVVDHGFIQAEEGMWQLWACIRGTKVGRIFYGWEGESLEKGPWKPIGITARAQEKYGEQTKPEERMQAPHFLKIDDVYHMFYTTNGVRLMTSNDGKNYQRAEIRNGSNLLYEAGGRDVMVMAEDDVYYAYSTVSQVSDDGWGKGSIILRTSTDLKNWGDYTIVSEGGIAGNGTVSAESPFVIKVDGYYYLFRSSSVTGKCYVYRSKNPYNFGVNDDRKLIATLPIRAPEIIEHNGQYYISDLADFKGIKLAKLSWKKDSE